MLSKIAELNFLKKSRIFAIIQNSIKTYFTKYSGNMKLFKGVVQCQWWTQRSTTQKALKVLYLRNTNYNNYLLGSPVEDFVLLWIICEMKEKD